MCNYYHSHMNRWWWWPFIVHTWRLNSPHHLELTTNSRSSWTVSRWSKMFGLLTNQINSNRCDWRTMQMLERLLLNIRWNPNENGLNAYENPNNKKKNLKQNKIFQWDHEMSSPSLPSLSWSPRDYYGNGTNGWETIKMGSHSLLSSSNGTIITNEQEKFAVCRVSTGVSSGTGE